MMGAPCKNCPDRRAGTADTPPCHSDCERYKAWRAVFDAGKADDHKGDAAMDFIVERVRAWRRERRRHQKK